LDLYKKRALADLLERLANVDGIEWIRLHYAYPSGFPMEVFDVMNKYDKICKYLDMPLQHISDNMLKAMRRGITKEKSIALVNEIREKVPGIALRTTLISGFPGETQKDHEEMIEWIEMMRFDRLGIFPYSHEENTHAFTMNDDVPLRTKKRRADAVMKVQQEISFQLNQQRIGNTYKVLFDRIEGDYFVGRTEFDSPEVDNEVLVKASEYVRIGDFANVIIESAGDYDLIGRLK
jgi:ribosomal protein S12 methylthiotransferase